MASLVEEVYLVGTDLPNIWYLIPYPLRKTCFLLFILQDEDYGISLIFEIAEEVKCRTASLTLSAKF